MLGADSDGGGEANLIYTWALTRGDPATVSYSANGTNAAKNTTVTFTKAGVYTFNVNIKDTGGLSVNSTVTVNVNQTLTSIVVSPANPSISPLGEQLFTATALDQFGLPMATQPSFIWSIVSGGGSIVPNGTTANYTAPLTGSSATIRATSASFNGSTTVSIVNQTPLLAASIYPSASPNPVNGATTNLSVLGADDGGEGNLTYTWSVIGTAACTGDILGQRHQCREKHRRHFQQGWNIQFPSIDYGFWRIKRHQSGQCNRILVHRRSEYLLQQFEIRRGFGRRRNRN